jgi:hypothetical protein
MHTFATTSSDDEIKEAVVEWSELIAQKRFADALAMFPPAEPEMTADELAKWIAGYGCPEPYPDGRTYELTSLRALPEFETIFRDRIDVDRENLYGLDPAEYIGMVHYDDVPLNGRPSDLTARFHIKKLGEDRITLEFLDIHVM